MYHYLDSYVLFVNVEPVAKSYHVLETIVFQAARCNERVQKNFVEVSRQVVRISSPVMAEVGELNKHWFFQLPFKLLIQEPGYHFLVTLFQCISCVPSPAHYPVFIDPNVHT